MKKLEKRTSKMTNSIECYARVTRLYCYCATCICPPPSVPNDIQLQKTTGAGQAAQNSIEWN